MNDPEMAAYEQGQLDIAKLMSMHDTVNWEIEKDRYDFRRKFYDLIKVWNGVLPDLLEIFHPENIELLLKDAINDSGIDWSKTDTERFVGFVIKTGYKNRPRYDDNGQPMLIRTTALHRAAKSLNRAISRELFKIYDSYDVNYIDEAGYSHLHVACQFDLLDDVEKFLDQGQDPNQVARETGDTPLHVAARYSSKEILRLLLKRGAQPNARDAHGSTPLHVIANCKVWHVRATVRLLLDDSLTPVQIDLPDNKGQTALHVALSRRHEKLAVLLLELGADPNLPDEQGCTPVHLLCKAGMNENLAELFFDTVHKKHELNLSKNRDNKCTSLRLAVKYELDKIDKLTRHSCSKATLVEKHGLTPQHFINKRHRDNNLLGLLYTLSVDPNEPLRLNVRDKFGNTPLHLALQGRRYKTVDWLLRHGADANLPDTKGTTPLHIVSSSMHSKDLIFIFFNMNVVNNLQVDAVDNHGQTALHYAVRNGNKQPLGLLLRAGADPNLADNTGATPVHVICSRNHDCELLETFFQLCHEVNRPVEVNARDRMGDTPLHRATRDGRKLPLVRTLLKYGADPNLTNNRGWTALQLVLRNDRTNVDSEDNVEDDEDINGMAAINPLEMELPVVLMDDRVRQITVPIHMSRERSHREDHIRRRFEEMLQAHTSDVVSKRAICGELLRSGANPDLTNSNGQTSLHIICHRATYLDDEMMSLFLTLVNQRPLQMDQRDRWGRTPLQLAVLNFMPDTFNELLERGASLLSFVFPSASDFLDTWLPRWPRHTHCSKLAAVAGFMSILERLERAQFYLECHQVTAVMKVLRELGLFDYSLAAVEYMRADTSFQRRSLQIRVSWTKNLQNVIMMRPRQFSCPISYQEFYDFACSGNLIQLRRSEFEVYSAKYICQIMLRKFCWECGMDSLRRFTNNRLPLEICEMILETFENEDLGNLFIATA